LGFRDDVDDDNNDAVVSDRTFSIAKKTWKILVKICVFEDFGLDRLCPPFFEAIWTSTWAEVARTILVRVGRNWGLVGHAGLGRADLLLRCGRISAAGQ
jgi:hypothetical protein